MRERNNMTEKSPTHCMTFGMKTVNAFILLMQGMGNRRFRFLSFLEFRLKRKPINCCLFRQHTSGCKHEALIAAVLKVIWPTL